MSKQATKYTGKSRKEDIVKKLTDKLGKSKAFFLADYKGLTHQQLETLRKNLKKSEAEFLVTKNTLLNLSLKQQSNETVKSLEGELKNSTATLFAYGDEIAAIKEVAKFAKNFSLPKIKIGFFDGKVVSTKDFEKLAIIPSRGDLLAILVGRLKFPIYGLHYALNWNLQRLVIALDNIKNSKH